MAWQRPFIPRGGLLYQTLVLMGSTGRYISTLTACLIFTVIWWYSIYRPLTYYLEQRAHTICKRQNDADNLLSIYQQSLNAHQTAQQLAHTLPDTYHYTISHEQQMEHWTRVLFDILKKNSIDLFSYSADRLIIESFCGTHTIHLTLGGLLAHISNFLLELKQQKIPMLCTRLSCTKTDNTIYLASIDMQIVTYAAKKDPSTLKS